MRAIFLRALRDKQFALAMFCTAGLLFLVLYIALFPTIQLQSEQLTKALGNYPKPLLKALNVEEINFSTLEKFLAVEEYSFTWPLLMIFLAVSFAGSLVRDIERGTIDFALTRPISRFKLYLGRVSASLGAVAAFSIASILVAIPISVGMGVDVIASNHVMMTAMGFIFGAAIVGIASLFGSVFSERGRAYTATGGLLLAMYIVNIVAQLKDGLSTLQYVSIFHYFDANAALTRGELSWGSIAVLVGVSLVTLALGALNFERRDIAAIG
ncbi:MAG TPA: ABC transporter permease subunit [Rhodothermia bacterium]|nr:ABC transporter permease subunit [Rhodothermia bacterium]